MTRRFVFGLVLFIEAAAHRWFPAFVLTAGIVLVVEMFWLWVHPYTACSSCKGRSGKNAGSDSDRWGRCWRCHGNVERPRVGARAVAGLLGKAWW